MRTVDWDASANELVLIDQRLLPGEFTTVRYSKYEDVAEAIRTMVVRGAPAIGAAAGYAMALAGISSKGKAGEEIYRDLIDAGKVLNAARPTAVNLAWAIKRMLNRAKLALENREDMQQVMVAEAQLIADEDIEINKRLSRFGADLIEDGDTIIHHCNTGALAVVDWGTALGVIRMAHELGKHIHVLVDETRPRLQGARLTAWELKQYGVPFDIISDNAAGYFLRNGKATKVFFGADRVASNGDVANKVGSYMLTLAAHDNHVPVYSVFPVSTVDWSIKTGDEIPIEERPMDEVLDISVHGVRVTPEGVTARNPAFDVTPSRLFTGWVTEFGVVYPPFEENLRRLMQGEVQ